MEGTANCERRGDKETCAACGAEFGCEPTGNCWCFAETVPAETLADLEGRYERCLCPACLRKAVSQEACAKQA